MTRNKRFKHRSAIIFLLTAAILIVSFSLVSSALPSALSVQSLESETVFNVDVVYAFVGKGPSEAPQSHFGVLHYPKSQYPSALYLNVTHDSSAEIESYDAIIEVYLIQTISDEGPTEKYIWFEGTNYSPSFSDSEKTSLTERIFDLIDLNTINGVRGHFRFNWTNNTSVLGGQVGSFGSYSSNPSGYGLWSAGKPNTISVTVGRVGYITSKGNSISVHVDTISTKETFQLEKYREGFLSNRLMPEDKLSQIDMFQPFDQTS